MEWTKGRTALSAAAVLLSACTSFLALKSFHAAGHRSELERRARMLETEQQTLYTQLRQLERERDQTSNCVAAASQENVRLRSDPAQSELLKLRGEIGVLQQELAASRALRQLSSDGFLAGVEKQPVLKSALRQNLQQITEAYFGSLFQELKLTAEQTEQVVQLISDWGSEAWSHLAQWPTEVPRQGR